MKLAFALIAIAGIVAALLAIRFDVLCLRDLAEARDDELRYLDRSTWTVVIWVSTPLGGLAYLTFGRVR